MLPTSLTDSLSMNLHFNGVCNPLKFSTKSSRSESLSTSDAPTVTLFSLLLHVTCASFSEVL